MLQLAVVLMSHWLFTLPIQVVTGALLIFRSMDLPEALVRALSPKRTPTPSVYFLPPTPRMLQLAVVLMSHWLFTLPIQVVTGALLIFRSMDLPEALVTISAVTLAGSVPRTKTPLPARVVYLMIGNWPTDITLPSPPILTVMVPLAERTPVPLLALMIGCEGLPKPPRSTSSVVVPEVPKVAPVALIEEPARRKRRLNSAPSATTTGPFAVVVPVGI